jgi:uracil-DNA glycosylase
MPLFEQAQIPGLASSASLLGADLPDLFKPFFLKGEAASDWAALFQDFLTSSAAQRLQHFLSQRLAQRAVIYPPDPLRAFRMTPRRAVRVVILGQDPYHGEGQAEGLAFSVSPGVRPPPSLQNIFKELRQEGLLSHPPATGSLKAWAQQGVLLLNTCLTVEAGLPASHAGQGWEALTDAVVQDLGQGERPLVFMLWGAHAQSKLPLINAQKHLVLQSNHPSPLSANRPPRPFMGCGHFSAARAWLAERGESVDALFGLDGRDGC